jgi:hypothetical protein
VGLFLRSAILHHSVRRGNFTLTLLLIKAHLLHYLFISSLPFITVYFLLAKCLRLPSFNFERKADTTDMQPHAAKHFHGIL